MNCLFSITRKFLSHRTYFSLFQQYIISKKLDTVFPRAAAFLANPQGFSLADNKTGLDVYYHDLSTLSTLSSLSRQINSDLQNLADHKYIAHQTAILYVRMCIMIFYLIFLDVCLTISNVPIVANFQQMVPRTLWFSVAKKYYRQLTFDVRSN